jgi:hypothetical protein
MPCASGKSLLPARAHPFCIRAPRDLAAGSIRVRPPLVRHYFQGGAQIFHLRLAQLAGQIMLNTVDRGMHAGELFNALIGKRD